MEGVSDDLLRNIFGRLNLESLSSCRLVCRQWASIIGSTEFAVSFQARPSNKARLLFTLSSTRDDRRFQTHSSSLQQPYSIHNSVAFRLSGTPPVGYDCVHGLISLGCTIMNPTLGWEIDLPLIDPNDSEEQRVLGFDPTRAQYKLLALRASPMGEPLMGTSPLRTPIGGGLRVEKRSGRGDYQVLTLGEDSNRWRIVNSTTPELPKTKSVCIDGMVYYFVLTGGTCSLVRFNVATETLDFFQVADGASSSLGQHLGTPDKTFLLNYKGKLGFVSQTANRNISEFGLWVLDDVENQTWSKLSFNLPHALYHYMGGLSMNQATGEIVLAAGDYNGTRYIVFIDVDTKATRITDLGYLSNRGFIIRLLRNWITL